MTRIGFIILLILPLVSFSQEHARILDLHTTYTITNLSDADITKEYRIQINSEHGYEFAYFNDYIDQFREIKKLNMVVYDSQGNEVKKLRKGDALELGLNSKGEMGDAKLVILDPDYRSFPFTLKVEVELKLKGFLRLPPFIPRDNFNLAVDFARLTVQHDPELHFIYNEANVTPPEKTEGKMIQRIYSVTQLPHIDKKIRKEDFYALQPKVLIYPENFELGKSTGKNTSWRDFGNWFYDLNDFPYSLTEDTKKFIDGLDKSDDKELIQNIYEYMQDKTRYVSIQLGIGGYKSMTTEDVEENGFGDCKALSTYMKNMLDYAGLKANYILVNAGTDAPDIDKERPGNQFNHVYLGVPLKQDTVYLECTSQTAPTDYPGTFTDDRYVLWIEKDNSRIIRSRIYDHEENIQKNEAKVIMNEYGNAYIKINTNNSGVFFDEIMIYESAPEDYISNYHKMKFSYKDFVVDNYSYEHQERSKPRFDTQYELDIRGLGRTVGDRQIIPLNMLSPIDDYVDRSELMEYASIKRGMTIEDIVRVTLPDNYWIYNLPENEKVEGAHGIYTVSAEFDGKELTIKRNITLYKGLYKQERFTQFEEFFDKVKKIENKKLVLNQKT